MFSAYLFVSRGDVFGLVLRAVPLPLEVGLDLSTSVDALLDFFGNDRGRGHGRHECSFFHTPSKACFGFD